MNELTMPLPVRSRVGTYGPIAVVTCSAAPKTDEHRRAAHAIADLLGGLVVEAMPGRRLAPELLGAGLVIPCVPASLLAPIASLCEWLELPYAGASPRAATLASDPALVSAVLTEAGLAVPAGVAVDAMGARVLDFLGPVSLSAIGVDDLTVGGIAATPEDLRAGLASALGRAERVWVSELCEGMAIRIPLVRNRSGELITGAIHDRAPGSFFAVDRPASSGSRFHPAGLTPRQDALARGAAATAYRSLGLSGVACVDLVLDGKTVTVEGIDIAPPLARDGLFAQQFAASGWAIADLLHESLAGALRAGHPAY